MARYAFITLFSVLGLFSPGSGTADELFIEKVDALSGNAMPEIREFIIRKLGCLYWEEKGGSRDEDARRATRNLRCASLETEEEYLRRTYARHPASMNALNAAAHVQASASGPTLEPTSSALGF